MSVEMILLWSQNLNVRIYFASTLGTSFKRRALGFTVQRTSDEVRLLVWIVREDHMSSSILPPSLSQIANGYTHHDLFENIEENNSEEYEPISRTSAK